MTVATALGGFWLPGPLIDRDRRLEGPSIIVDVRPFHSGEELPARRPQALDVLPLPLGKQHVESQRALADPLARDHDQPVVRQIGSTFEGMNRALCTRITSASPSASKAVSGPDSILVVITRPGPAR